VENKKDLEEIPENVRKTIKFVLADNMETVLNTALVKPNRRAGKRAFPVKKKLLCRKFLRSWKNWITEPQQLNSNTGCQYIKNVDIYNKQFKYKCKLYNCCQINM